MNWKAEEVKKNCGKKNEKLQKKYNFKKKILFHEEFSILSQISIAEIFTFSISQICYFFTNYKPFSANASFLQIFLDQFFQIFSKISRSKKIEKNRNFWHFLKKWLEFQRKIFWQNTQNFGVIFLAFRLKFPLNFKIFSPKNFVIVYYPLVGFCQNGDF